jgi:hypothetical protein
MQLPIIHLNGSGKDRLVEDGLRAHQALSEAVRALSLMYPNGRDYYPISNTALAFAETEHSARIAKVRAVMDEVEAWVQQVADGGHKAEVAA